MKITAVGDNVLRGTVQSILLVEVCGTDDVLRIVKLPIVLVPRLTLLGLHVCLLIISLIIFFFFFCLARSSRVGDF